MGEYGAYPKAAHPVETYTNYWAQYVTHSAYTHGVVPMGWDTGAAFDRTSGAQRPNANQHDYQRGQMITRKFEHPGDEAPCKQES